MCAGARDHQTGCDGFRACPGPLWSPPPGMSWVRPRCRVSRGRRGPAAALAAAAGMGCAEVLELGGYLLSGVFLDEVRGAGQQDRSVIGECLLESPARAVPEGEVFHAPDDQGGPVSDLGQPRLHLCEVTGGRDQLTRGDRGRSAALRVAPRREVRAHDLGRYGLREPAGEEDPRGEIEPAVQYPPGRTAENRTEQADSRLGCERPRERVPDDQPAPEFRAAACQAEPDRPAPVLHHQREPGEAEPVYEAFNDRAVLAGREMVA